MSFSNDQDWTIPVSTGTPPVVQGRESYDFCSIRVNLYLFDYPVFVIDITIRIVIIHRFLIRYLYLVSLSSGY